MSSPRKHYAPGVTSAGVRFHESAAELAQQLSRHPESHPRGHPVVLGFYGLIRAKIYRIASGEEAWLDYDRIMPIIKNVGFNGWMSIVFEGQDELDEPTAVPLANSFMRSMLARYEM